jgi:hypothetical protein
LDDLSEGEEGKFETINDQDMANDPIFATPSKGEIGSRGENPKSFKAENEK